MPSNHRKKKHKKPAGGAVTSGEPDCPEVKEQLASDDSKKLYTVKRSDQVGRYIVASKDLKAGEAIIEVLPLVVGPCAESDPVCLGCHRTFEADSPQIRCEGCSWPICSPACPGLTPDGTHRTLECIPLREKAVSRLLQASTAKEQKLMYEAILTLRCMLLATVDPTRYRGIQEMDPLNAVRQNIPKLWKRNQKEIVSRIRDDWGFSEFSEQELHTICGVIEVNAFEVGQEPVKARALFPEAYLLMHDCTPNTGHTDALRTHALTGTWKRRQHLIEEKFFWCRCARCRDPTEFGTNCGALKCSKCHRGCLLPVNPLEQESEWRCTLCPSAVSAQTIVVLLEQLSKKLDAIDGNDVAGYEQFLQAYGAVLHDNHYLMLSAKHSLCELYGKINGYLIPELSPEQLKRKETVCRDLLEVIDQLEPGLSRLRGTIMYELHVPLMIEAGQLFQGGSIQRAELRRRLKEVQRLLRESERILALEPEGSPEYGMAVAARDAIKNMGTI
ncbi:SET domain-containing protein SmydA-8-like isoform X2 [Anopheles aquasalis]|uniref:SET domain-containing protein SmydA-8-like isoform X2 n=1 Tax=Anopheles aquasalis TaxID=42839 RepID=UPI00215A78FA|nr:SET domain-containing protein SmydA-8-like isoform X2 [Anopheles aquasalis]